jgi:uncharacterized protein YkwD
VLSRRRWLLTVVGFAGVGVTRAFADKDDKPAVKVSRDEKSIVDQTNAARAKEKLEGLTVNAQLMEAARAHAANMAKQRKFDHVLDGKKPVDRTKEAGYPSALVGENIAQTSRLSTQQAFKSWMESKGHRGNILSDKYNEIGVALSRDAKGTCYYVQVFGGKAKE